MNAELSLSNAAIDSLADGVSAASNLPDWDGQAIDYERRVDALC